MAKLSYNTEKEEKTTNTSQNAEVLSEVYPEDTGVYEAIATRTRKESSKKTEESPYRPSYDFGTGFLSKETSIIDALFGSDTGVDTKSEGIGESEDLNNFTSPIDRAEELKQNTTITTHDRSSRIIPKHQEKKESQGVKYTP